MNALPAPVIHWYIGDTRPDRLSLIACGADPKEVEFTTITDAGKAACHTTCPDCLAYAKAIAS